MINLFTDGGADKFLEFDQIYENTKVIRLEDYRSTQNILSVASNLISITNQDVKTLAQMEEGELVTNCFKNGKDENRYF